MMYFHNDSGGVVGGGNGGYIAWGGMKSLGG